jgi:hypothetical protein
VIGEKEEYDALVVTFEKSEECGKGYSVYGNTDNGTHLEAGFAGLNARLVCSHQLGCHNFLDVGFTCSRAPPRSGGGNIGSQPNRATISKGTEDSLNGEGSGFSTASKARLRSECFQDEGFTWAQSKACGSIFTNANGFSPAEVSKAYYYYGEVYAYNHQYEQAVESYNRSLDLRQTAQAHGVRATSLTRLGKMDEAQADCDAAARLLPGSSVANSCYDFIRKYGSVPSKLNRTVSSSRGTALRTDDGLQLTECVRANPWGEMSIWCLAPTLPLGGPHVTKTVNGTTVYVSDSSYYNTIIREKKGNRSMIATPWP